MSKTMHFFRKNQKAFLAVFGVLIIFVFTVGSIILEYMSVSGQQSTEAEPVVTWKRGTITEREMQDMLGAHNLAVESLSRVASAAMQRGAMPYGFDVNVQQGAIGIPRSVDEPTVMQIALLADKAKSLGMTVSDEAVKQFLYRLGGDQLKDGDIKIALHEALGDRMTEQQFFDQMKTELLAQHMRFLGRTGVVRPVQALAPAEAYTYFERVTRQAQIESLPVKVADFVDQVTTQPSEKELLALYEKYKEFVPNPAFPEPGFRVPRKIAVQYVKADFEKLLTEEQAKITDEQIQAEYDRRIAAGEFKKPELAPVEPTTEEPKTDEPKTDEPKTDEPKTDEPKTDEPKTEEAKTEEAKTEEPKADSEPAENPPPENASRSNRVNSEIFVSAQDEPATDAPATEAPATEDKDPPTPQEETPPATEPEPKTEPAPTTEPKTEPTTEPAPPATEGEKTEPATETPATEPAPTEPAPTEPAPTEPEFQPLEKVRDQILVALASQPAQQRMDAAFQQVETALRKYAAETSVQRSQAKTKDDPKLMPAPFDVAQAARDAGLEYGELPLMGPFEMQETEIGAAQARGGSPFGGGASFIDTAFAPDKQVYRPDIVTSGRTEFLFWLTKEEADFTPDFKTAREDVLKAWKWLQARELARAAAEKNVKDVTADKSLAEVFGETKVTVSGLFPWLRSFAAFGFGEPQLSQVDGVEYAGNDFMRVVFNLPVGGVGVAPNQPESIFYVVRVLKRSPGDEVMRELFASSSPQRLLEQIGMVAYREHQELDNQWLADLSKEYDVKWQRAPRRMEL
jgi:hypothetical protein